MMKPITFHKDRVFRETKGVHFSDVWVQNQNGLDLVVHRGFSVSPPNQQGTGEKTFYLHHHQTDNNRCIHGRRVFELVAPGDLMQHQHYVVLWTITSEPWGSCLVCSTALSLVKRVLSS